jgi:hypothetical protein
MMGGVMSMSVKEVTDVLGPVDEVLVADIVATGATSAELAEAWAWVNSDEALVGEGRHLPSGRVARLIDLLEPDEEEL